MRNNRLAPLDDVLRVPLTPAQSRRLAKAQAAAAAAAAVRDEVLSAIIEGVVDRDFSGWQIQITETEVVLAAPVRQARTRGTPPADRPEGNGTNGTSPQSQADVMSP